MSGCRVLLGQFRKCPLGGRQPIPMHYNRRVNNQPPNIMRKIEEQMNMAIRSRKNWSGSNTTVRCFKENGVTTEVNVLLHGNCIAWFDTASNDFNISSAGWETVTTKSLSLIHI